MSDAPKIPIVTYWFRGAEQRMGFGYLGHHDGEAWCFPDEELSRPSDGFAIEGQLREQPDTADRKLYLYTTPVEAPHKGPKTFLPPQSRGQTEVRVAPVSGGRQTKNPRQKRV
jgi:hypothetical protein